MASNAPPPYTEQSQPAFNPGYAAAPANQGYPPPANSAYPAYPPSDPSKFGGPQPGYPAGPYYPAGQYPAASPYPPPPTSGPYPVSGPQQQGQQQQTIVVTSTAAPVATGNCPVCRVGYITDDFSCCGICLAIFFFPIGLICCLLMRDRRCSHCGAHM